MKTRLTSQVQSAPPSILNGCDMITTLEEWISESNASEEYDRFYNEYGDSAASRWDWYEHHYADYVAAVEAETDFNSKKYVSYFPFGH
jgi:hypothetical protein